MHKLIQSILSITIVLFFSCKSTHQFVAPLYSEEESVDYQSLANWAAHPNKLDESDSIPGKKGKANQVDPKVDVFFIHPTTFTKIDEKESWNASLADEKLNKKTDETTIKYQASIFNEAGKVYAPRYRQAQLRAYYSQDKVNTDKAFEIAYSDVEAAFLYYIKNWNGGRPFIIASHSQGTTHAIPLIKNHIEGTDLEQKLIAAYIVGMVVKENEFNNLKPCESPDQTNCFISWRTFRFDHTPTPFVGDYIVNTNPLTWKLDGAYAEKSLNKGAVLRKFDKVFTQRVDAQAVNGMLWAHRPKVPFSFLLTTKNYHIADFNFYYMNIKENAKLRVDNYLNN